MGDNHVMYGRSSLSRKEVDELLASGQNASSRIRKACYPCNKRKVKCDREQCQPCSNCSKRSHPELCFFEAEASASTTRASQKRKLGQGQGSTSPAQALAPSPNTADNSAPLSQGQKEHMSLRHTLENNIGPPNIASVSPTNHPPHNNATLSTYYMPPETCRDSMTNLVQDRACGSPQIFNARVQPLFGLRDTSASYAFVRRDDQSQRRCILSLIPDRDNVLRFFRSWESVHSPFQAIVSDIDALEIQMCDFVTAVKEKSIQSHFNGLRGPELRRELAWLSLLLAILALGARFSDLTTAERTSVSREYTRNAFECLRLANFLSKPCETSIQTLLLLGVILQDEFQPDAAWAMIGTTIRLAQSLGLNKSGHQTDALAQNELTKQKLWWAVVWQETLLSMCFGRPSSLFCGLGTPPNTPEADGIKSGFIEAMYAVIKIAADALDPSLTSPRISNARAALLKIEDLDTRVLPRLISKPQCRTLRERLELHTFCIHRNFVASYFLQLTIRDTDSPEEKKDMIRQCRITSSMTSRAYIDLASLSVLPLRSWPLLHNALGSVLLRGFLGEIDEPAKVLLHDFLDLLQNLDEQADGIIPKVCERHSSAVETLKMMCQQSASMRSSGAGSPAKYPHLFVSVDRSDAERNSHDGTMGWAQSDDAAISPDDFWTSYFANPMTHESETDLFGVLEPDLWNIGL